MATLKASYPLLLFGSPAPRSLSESEIQISYHRYTKQWDQIGRNYAFWAFFPSKKNLTPTHLKHTFQHFCKFKTIVGKSGEFFYTERKVPKIYFVPMEIWSFLFKTVWSLWNGTNWNNRLNNTLHLMRQLIWECLATKHKKKVTWVAGRAVEQH
jgi:hypothetical protein